MNIIHQSSQGPERSNNSKVTKDFGLKRGDRAQQAAQDPASSSQRVGQDKIVLSAGAQAFGDNQVGLAAETPIERAERIEHLKRLAVSSNLNTVERAKLSAERLLGGE